MIDGKVHELADKALHNQYVDKALHNKYVDKITHSQWAEQVCTPTTMHIHRGFILLYSLSLFSSFAFIDLFLI